MDKHNSSNQKEIVEMLIEEGYSLEKITLALMDMMNRKNNDYSGLSDVKPLVIVRKERKNNGIGRKNKAVKNRRTENGKQTEKEERTYIIEKIVKQKRRNIMVKIMNQIKKEEKRDL